MIIYVRETKNIYAMQKLKNELQQFVDALNKSAIVSKADLKGNITYVNDKFCEISGYTEGELIANTHRTMAYDTK